MKQLSVHRFATPCGGIGVTTSTTSPTAATPITRADVEALQHALREDLPVSCSEALAWVALDAAGLGGGFRDAVTAAGGPIPVVQRRAFAAFTTPRTRTRVLNPQQMAERLGLLLPWIEAGIGVVAVERDVARFADHPACAFFAAGRPLPSSSRPVVAIVGSRAAGPQYLQRTARLSSSLARQGAVIVSGGAVGIDTAAQQAARAEDGEVVMITGRALHGRAAIPDEVKLDPGLCWLSPYAPWSSPGGSRSRFAARNAFIAAMADVVIAVCGGPESGTRHTIEAALRFGRPVFALRPDPHHVDGDLAAMAERLVATSTGILVDEHVGLETLLAHPRGVVPGAIADWLHGPEQALLPLTSSSSSPASSASSALLPEIPLWNAQTVAANDDAAPLVRLLCLRGALTIDDAAAALSTSVRELLVDVALLEMDGALRREGALLSLPSAACKA